MQRCCRGRTRAWSGLRGRRARLLSAHAMQKNVSARLESILSLLRPCALLADVGTDHGLVPIAAVQRGTAARAIAADLRQAPLEVARRNIAQSGLGERVTVHRGDGLLGLADQPIDALVMAGVSGALMLRVFAEGASVLASVEQLVLQPNQDHEQVRAWAHGHGFQLRDERMLEERGQFFATCAFDKRAGTCPAYDALPLPLAAQYMVGPLLLARRDATALRWCELQRLRLFELVQAGRVALEPEHALWQAACAHLREPP